MLPVCPVLPVDSADDERAELFRRPKAQSDLSSYDEEPATREILAGVLLDPLEGASEFQGTDQEARHLILGRRPEDGDEWVLSLLTGWPRSIKKALGKKAPCLCLAFEASLQVPQQAVNPLATVLLAVGSRTKVSLEDPPAVRGRAFVFRVRVNAGQLAFISKQELESLLAAIDEAESKAASEAAEEERLLKEALSGKCEIEQRGHRITAKLPPLEQTTEGAPDTGGGISSSTTPCVFADTVPVLGWLEAALCVLVSAVFIIFAIFARRNMATAFEQKEGLLWGGERRIAEFEL